MAENKITGITNWEGKSPLHLPDDILTGYNFTVFIQGMKMGFTRITNMERFVETDPMLEGGVNDHVHSLLKPVSSEKVLTFERGVATASLMNLAKQALTMRFQVGQRLTTDIIIIVNGRDGGLQKLYTVNGGLVKKWRCSDLDASSSQVLIESFEVAYERLEEQKVAALAAAGAAALKSILG